MNIAMLWIGHVRTFHRIWPNLTIQNIIHPLGGIVKNTRHFFYTSPAAQCRRNRANDPPIDYCSDDALLYVKNNLKPDYLEIREHSAAAKNAVALIRKQRLEQGPDWINIEALIYQYVKRTEVWNDFTSRIPEWNQFDAIIFNRPDVFLYDKIVSPSWPLDDTQIHTFTSLGPHKDLTGLDDRWALGSPKAMQKYMPITDCILYQYGIQKRPWCPEEINRRHADRQKLKIVKCAYQSWPETASIWEKDHVGIARFQHDDGQTLKQALCASRRI